MAKDLVLEARMRRERALSALDGERRPRPARFEDLAEVLLRQVTAATGCVQTRQPEPERRAAHPSPFGSALPVAS